MKTRLTFLLLAILVSIFGQTIYGQNIKLSYPVLDNNNCKIELEILRGYQKYLKLPLSNGSLNITRDYLISNDTSFLINVPDTLDLPGIFITSEWLQLKKTPNPDSLANFIIRQYEYFKVDIGDIEVNSFTTKENTTVSKLSFLVKKTNQYFINYCFFINNRSLTIGLSHRSKEIVNKFDDMIINLKQNCAQQ